jgi:hypothetical protein
MKKQMMRDEEGEEENDSYWKPSKFRPTKFSPIFLLTFAQILAGTRSFKSAIGQRSSSTLLFRSHAHIPSLPFAFFLGAPKFTIYD